MKAERSTSDLKQLFLLLKHSLVSLNIAVSSAADEQIHTQKGMCKVVKCSLKEAHDSGAPASWFVCSLVVQGLSSFSS